MIQIINYAFSYRDHCQICTIISKKTCWGGALTRSFNWQRRLTLSDQLGGVAKAPSPLKRRISSSMKNKTYHPHIWVAPSVNVFCRIIAFSACSGRKRTPACCNASSAARAIFAEAACGLSRLSQYRTSQSSHGPNGCAVSKGSIKLHSRLIFFHTAPFCADYKPCTRWG